MSSHEVALAYGDMRRMAELEARAASALSALLLVQADAESLRAGVLAYFVLPHEISDHRLRLQLIDLARAEHPGQAMANEVAAARAEIDRARAVAADLVDQFMQFPEGYIGHEFMSAQEDAIEYFETIGWLRGELYERYWWTEKSGRAKAGAR